MQGVMKKMGVSAWRIVRGECIVCIVAQTKEGGNMAC